MSEFKEVRLKDITALITKGTTPTTVGFDYVDVGVNFIKAESVTHQGIIDDSVFAKISEEAHEKLSRSQLKEDDILFSIAGVHLGKNAIVKEKYLPANTNQALAIIRLDKEKTLPEYIHYYFLDPYQIRYINSLTAQSAQPNINLTDTGNLKIKLPTISKQEEIVSVLSAFDDLIENNTRRIAILEEMARLIYREWFVYYRYPGHENEHLVDSGTELGEVPEGWEIGTIGDLYDVKSGFAFKSKKLVDQGSFGVIKIGNIQSGDIDVEGVQFIENDEIPDRASKFKLHPGDVLIAMTGAKVGKVGIMPKTTNPYYLNQRVGKYFGKNELLKSHLYLYSFLNTIEAQANIEHLAQGAAQPNISATDLKSLKLPISPAQLLNEFDQVTLSMRDEILTLRQKNVKLKETRDLLLPKLISGKVDVIN